MFRLNSPPHMMLHHSNMFGSPLSAPGRWVSTDAVEQKGVSSSPHTRSKGPPSLDWLAFGGMEMQLGAGSMDDQLGNSPLAVASPTATAKQRRSASASSNDSASTLGVHPSVASNGGKVGARRRRRNSHNGTMQVSNAHTDRRGRPRIVPPNYVSYERNASRHSSGSSSGTVPGSPRWASSSSRRVLRSAMRVQVDAPAPKPPKFVRAGTEPVRVGVVFWFCLWFLLLVLLFLLLFVPPSYSSLVHFG